MVWDGSASWEIYEDYFILTAIGFDADAEKTAAPLKLTSRLPFIPSHYSMYVVRSAGAQDVIDVDLEGTDSAETSTFVIATVTDSTGGSGVQSSTTDYTSATGKLSEHLFPYIRVIVNTVGVGNTLTVTVIGRR